MAGREWTVVDQHCDAVPVWEVDLEKTFVLFDFVEIKSVRRESGTQRSDRLWWASQGGPVLV